jgi:anti-sigma factor RsiW
MVRKQRNNPASGDWHPSERELLLYVNGELKAKQAAKVLAHVEGCWACSAKRDRLTGAVSAFMQFREFVLKDVEFPERAGRRFETRLKRLRSEDAERSRSTWLKELMTRLAVPKIPVAAAAGIGVLACFLFIWFRLTSVPSVSARELLRRTELAEVQRVEAVAAPVVHQQLRVTRRQVNSEKSESVRWEIWHDPRGRRFRQAIHDTTSASRPPSGKPSSRGRSSGKDETHPILDELAEILGANQLNLQQPMSAAAFSSWRSSIRQETESVVEKRLPNGEKALAIATTVSRPFVKHAIMEAELVVREQDWHPVEERLKVYQADGVRNYELSETSYEVVSLNL